MYNFQNTHASDKENDHCLCKFLKPIIRLCQIFGILPVQNSSSDCKINHKWISFPVLSNFIWIFANCFIVLGSILLTYMYKDRLYGSGVDMLAFGMVMFLNVSCTTAILLFGNYTASNFAKGWELLHHATDEISLSYFEKMKHPTYLFPLYVFQDFIFNVAVYIWTTLTGLPGFEIGLAAVMVPFMTILSNIIPNLVSAVYILLILVIRKSFKILNQNLEVLLQDGHREKRTEEFARQLKKLKNLHEELCASVENVNKSFGLQNLAVFVATCVSFVMGIYGFIIGTQSSDTSVFSTLGVGYGLTSTAAAVRTFFVICSCQLMMNEANGTAHVLNGHDMQQFPEEIKALVIKFLQKIGKFPVQTKCCNIFNIGNGFLAAATTNVVTYVLILMQFRFETRGRPRVTQLDTSTIDPLFNFSTTNYHEF